MSSKYRIIKVGPSESSGPTIYQRHPLNHVHKQHIQPFLKHPQGRWLHHFPGQTVPKPDYSFWGEMSPNFQFKPPLAKLEVILSSPITCEKRPTP